MRACDFQLCVHLAHINQWIFSIDEAQRCLEIKHFKR